MNSLPDFTPLHKDASIQSFESQLCCHVNPIAIINNKKVCVNCFLNLKDNYTGDEWNIDGI